MGRDTLLQWVKRYKEFGEDGLRNKVWSGRSKISPDVRRKIVSLKEENPGFGIRRISDIVKVKPGRMFSRDHQEIRAKARGLEKKRRGRPTDRAKPFTRENSMPEVLTNSKGVCYALS